MKHISICINQRNIHGLGTKITKTVIYAWNNMYGLGVKIYRKEIVCMEWESRTYRDAMYGWIRNPRHIETTCMYGLGIQNM